MQSGEKQSRQWTHEQKYVYFRLKESLAGGRWEAFRPPVIGLSSLVEETAAVVECYLAEGWEEPSHILSELRDRLRSSALFDKSGYASHNERGRLRFTLRGLSWMRAIAHTRTEPQMKGAGNMKSITKYVGLDVSKKSVDVAVADHGREAPRYWGKIPNCPEAVSKLMRKLGDPKELLVCYEAGPTGYDLYRQLCQRRM